MRELNPLIRNAIYTFLVDFKQEMKEIASDKNIKNCIDHVIENIHPFLLQEKLTKKAIRKFYEAVAEMIDVALCDISKGGLMLAIYGTFYVPKYLEDCEYISMPVIEHTDTLLSIGRFTSTQVASACLKYVKSKFVRCMLGTLKATQHNSKDTWINVTMQDFMSNSDIDWSKSIPEINTQLYAKYGLSKEEVGFIESMIKPM